MATPTWDLSVQTCGTFDGGWYIGTGTGTNVGLTTIDSRTCYFIAQSSGVTIYIVNTNIVYATNVTIEIDFMVSNLLSTISSSASYSFSFYTRDTGTFPTSSRFFINTNTCSYPQQITYKSGASTIVRNLVDLKANLWYTYRNCISGTHSAYWINGNLTNINTSARNSASGASDNTIGIQVSSSADIFTIYIDNIRVSATVAEPDLSGVFRVQGENIVTHLRQVGSFNGGDSNGSGTYSDAESVSYFTGKDIYGIPLVSTTDSLASKIRFYDGSAVKSFMKHPSY